jgi:hypothetical protein
VGGFDPQHTQPEVNMLEVAVLTIVFAVIALWTIGFVRAVKRQPIKDRLAMYCERER